MAEEAAVTREQLIDLLNEDLAREYQAIIAYVVYSQVLKGAEYMNIADGARGARRRGAAARDDDRQAHRLSRRHADGDGRCRSMLSEKAKEMLRADLENENDTITQLSRAASSSARRCRSTRSPKTSARSCARSRNTRSIWRRRSARMFPTCRGCGARRQEKEVSCPPMSTLSRDLRYAIRALLANPGFTAVAILSLAHRHRRQHRDLQRRERAPPASAAVRERRSAGHPLEHVARPRHRRGLVLDGAVLRHPEWTAKLRGCRALRSAPMRI